MGGAEDLREGVVLSIRQASPRRKMLDLGSWSWLWIRSTQYFLSLKRAATQPASFPVCLRASANQLTYSRCEADVSEGTGWRDTALADIGSS